MRAGTARSFVAAIAAVLSTASAGCTSDAAIASPKAAAEPPPLPSATECSPRLLDDPETPDPPPAARSWGPRVDLAELVPRDAPARARAAPRKRIDLGHLSRKVEGPPPGGGIDVPSLTLPRHVPRPDLPPDLRALWDREEASRADLRRAQIGQARAERKERACAERGCADRGCLGELKRGFEEGVRAARDRLEKERGRLIVNLRAQADAAGDKAAPGVLLALATTLEDVVATTVDADLPRLLKEPIALYARAAALTGPTSDIGWFARYRLAVALDNAGEREKSKMAFAALAQESTGERAAWAIYEAARLTLDPGLAADAYRRAAAAAPDGSPMRTNALQRWSHAALVAERPAEALDAGALRIPDIEARRSEGDGSSTDVAGVMAEALGRLVASRRASNLPRVPLEVFAMIARSVASDAERRFDIHQATFASEVLAARAPESPEAASAREKPRSVPRSATDDASRRAELEARLGALLRDCGHDHLIVPPPFDHRTRLELVLTAEERAPRSPKVTAELTKVSPSSFFLRCVEARGPAYFVGAPADLRVKLTLYDF